MQTSWGYSTLTFGDWQRRHHLEQQGICIFHKSFFSQIIYLHFEEQRKVFFKIQRFSSLHQNPNWRKNQDYKE
jgi:hypothetical protein